MHNYVAIAKFMRMHFIHRLGCTKVISVVLLDKKMEVQVFFFISYNAIFLTSAPGESILHPRNFCRYIFLEFFDENKS